MPDQAEQFIVTVMARDRVGIVHDIARPLSEMQGDLADTRQQVLLGYLTMILYVSFPDPISGKAIKEKLLESWQDPAHQPEISVKPMHEPQPAPTRGVPQDAYVMTARGEDRIGFVAMVSGFCAQNDINILDLSTTVADSTYIMILLVDLSRCDNIAELRNRLETFKKENDLDLVLQHHDIFKATNEIQMNP